MKSRADIFSIDVSAHLRKLSAYSDRSPAWYPLELVRSALRRRARRVDVIVSPRRLEMRDDGDGIDPVRLDALARIFSPAVSASAREESLAQCQDGPGTGLLAVFASDPSKVVVENAHCGVRRRLVFATDAPAAETAAGAVSEGTRIIIFRRGAGKWRRLERRMISEFCRSANGEVWLDGRQISGKRPLVDYVAAALTDSGMVAVPQWGDLCRIRLLDQGIPWSFTSWPSPQGLSFIAALERTTPADALLPARLAPSARKLYEWLAERFLEQPPRFRERIEELLLAHARRSGDFTLLEKCPLFTLWPSGAKASLVDIKSFLARSSLRAIPARSASRFSSTVGENVLALTPSQTDLLANRLRLPIRFLAPLSSRRFSLNTLWHCLRRLGIAFLGRFSLGAEKPLAQGRLTTAEREMTGSLERWLSLIPGRRNDIPSVVWSNALSVTPTRLKNVAGRPCLIIRRRHPQLPHLLAALAADAKNIEWLVPILLPPAARNKWLFQFFEPGFGDPVP